MFKILSFANKTVTNEDIDKLVGDLNKTDQEVTLDLSNTELAICEERLINLATAIEISRVITEVKMTNLRWSITGTIITTYRSTLLESCRKNKSILTLDLTGWVLDNKKAFNVVLEIIKHHPRLRTLILKDCNFSLQSLNEIEGALAQNETRTITKLCLYARGPRTADRKAIVQRIDDQCKLHDASPSTLQSTPLITSLIHTRASDSSANLIPRFSALNAALHTVDTSSLFPDRNHSEHPLLTLCNTAAGENYDSGSDTDCDTENESFSEANEPSRNSTDTMAEILEEDQALPDDELVMETNPQATQLAELQKIITKQQEQLNSKKAAHKAKKIDFLQQFNELTAQNEDLKNGEIILYEKLEQYKDLYETTQKLLVVSYMQNLKRLERLSTQLEEHFLLLVDLSMHFIKHNNELIRIREHNNDPIRQDNKNPTSYTMEQYYEINYQLTSLERSRTTLSLDLNNLQINFEKIRQITGDDLSDLMKRLKQLEENIEALGKKLIRLHDKVKPKSARVNIDSSPTTRDTTGPLPFSFGYRSELVNGEGPSQYGFYFSTAEQLKKRKHSEASADAPTTKRPTT